MSLLASRRLVLTTAKPGEMPHEYLTDRDRFPLEAITTTDLAKARTWQYAPGYRRFLKRNPHLVGYRHLWVDLATIEAAKASDGKAAAALPAAYSDTAAPAPRRHSSRLTKTDPNKRAKRAGRKRAVRTLRKIAGKPGRKAGRKSAALAKSR